MTGPINLKFGDTVVEVSADAEGGLEALAAQVEAKLGLHADSFSLFDDFGKVDDSMALQRARDMAGAGPCTLQVHEAPQWKKIREMDAKISMLVARCPVVDSVLMNIEERSMMRFEKLGAALEAVDERANQRSWATLTAAEGVDTRAKMNFQELDAKISNSIAPLLQSVALQEMELKAKLDSLDSSLFSQELDTKVSSSIAPMLQSMALHQMDLKDKLDSLQMSPNTSCNACEQLAQSLENTRKELSDLQASSVTKFKALQIEVHNITEQPAANHAWGQIMSAAQQDLGKSPKLCKSPFNALGGAGCDQWMIDGLGSDSFSPMAYSKKSFSNSMNNGGAAVPFARQFAAPRQLAPMLGNSRSLPQLPAMVK